MGNDGGSIPGRAELVKEKKKEQRAESDLIGRFRAKLCALTKERLKKPIAICRLGYLYNYENIINFMMQKKMPVEFAHIRRVKDLKQINFKENPDKECEFPFICPISQQVYNGRNRFLALWGCGCVFSEKIIKDIKMKEKKCPVCDAKYLSKDIVELGLSNEEIEMKKARLIQEQNEETRLKRKQKQLDEQDEEDIIQKKVCTDQKKQINHNQHQQKPDRHQKMVGNIMEKVGQTDEIYRDSETYKSLFHTHYTLGNNLFTRNVRFGLR